MAATFVALLTLARLEDLKRRQGYAAAVAEIDALRDRIGAEWAGLRHLRSGRGAVEFAFEAGSRAEAERRIGLMLDGLARCGDLVAAAVESLDGEVSEALLRQADGLLQAAEADGRPLLIAAEDLTGDDQRLMADLRQAIGENGLALHYQPKLRARTGDLAGAEALVRWTHPVLGPIPPDHFIPMAERSGDIAALTRWVIDRALADRDRLVAQGLAMPIHVNISAPLLADRAFAEDMLARLAGHTRGIGFEITETALIADPEGTLTRLEELARAGVHLSIDDYGAGFSSMAYLRRLPVRELKIDKMFVAGLTASARDPLLVRSTIDLAHALEMEVTAEGVETAATLALLQVMGCDIVQGFFLSRPLPFAGLSSYAAGSAPARLPRPVTLRERLAQRRGDGQA